MDQSSADSSQTETLASAQPLKDAPVTLNLAVNEFALPAPRQGSLSAESGFGPVPAVGTILHLELQNERQLANPDYKTEKWITHTFATHDKSIRIQVSGRMDGFVGGPAPLIEEFKTSYQPERFLENLKSDLWHPYRLQLLTYGYLHYLNRDEQPTLHLTVVSARHKTQWTLPIDLDVTMYEAWLKKRLAEIVSEHRQFEKLKSRRQREAENLPFPFQQPRTGQIELMQTIEDSLPSNKNLLLQAPTGLGKTVGVLLPTLKAAFQRAEKVIYVTPKNSQHQVAEEAVRKLQDCGSAVRSVTVTAKARLCLKDQVLCEPSYCEYAKDHYTKVAEKKLIAKLNKKQQLTAKEFLAAGKKSEVCPFDLQMETVAAADVIIADYNYVFSPRQIRTKLSHNGYGAKTKPNLVIDEAHNLPSRAADYFSAALNVSILRKHQSQILLRTSSVGAEAIELIDQCITAIEETPPRLSGDALKVDVDVERFQLLNVKAQELVARHLTSPFDLQKKDPVLEFAQDLSQFTQCLEAMSDDFFASYTPHIQGGSLKITCCDASQSLRESYADFDSVVAFSATMKPFDYSISLLGMSPNSTKTAEFLSPFSKSNRKLLIVPQVSTKKADRDQSAPKIREAIERIVALRPGNYFVFFPSFQFMEQVYDGCHVSGFRLTIQPRDITRQQTDEILAQLGDKSVPSLIFAVQGGVFSEGVDYPGDLLIGAIVVGPALPQFDFERETIRQVYAKKYGMDRAFDYAYTYPAMARVIQSAGRVIRSESDRGLIVLMDRRFLHQNYVRAMPNDWLEADRPPVSQKILSDIEEFWNR